MWRIRMRRGVRSNFTWEIFTVPITCMNFITQTKPNALITKIIEHYHSQFVIPLWLASEAHKVHTNCCTLWDRTFTNITKKLQRTHVPQVPSYTFQASAFNNSGTSVYVARPQSRFPTRPTASKPYIARSDCAYVIEQWCSMAHALTVLPVFSQ
jgi:hypothetical protein